MGIEEVLKMYRLRDRNIERQLRPDNQSQSHQYKSTTVKHARKIDEKATNELRKLNTQKKFSKMEQLIKQFTDIEPDLI